MRLTMATAPANLNGYLDPAGYEADTAHEIPAVKVTLAQNQSGSGGTGPMPTYFASALGVGSMTLQGRRRRSCRLARPSTLNTSCFPFALPQVMSRRIGRMILATPFTVGSAQHDSSGGQWTSLGSTDNSAYYIDSLILGTETPAYLSTGGQVYIQNGERGSVYNTVSAQFAAQPGHIYMVPVVEDGFSNGAWANVVSFVPYQITGCSGSGNDCYVTGHFVPGYVDPSATGVSGKYTGDPSLKGLVLVN